MTPQDAAAFRYEYPAIDRIVFGEPSDTVVAEQATRLGARRVMMLTTRSLAEGSLVRSIETALGTRHVGTFAGIAAHSPRPDVLAAAEAVRAKDADLLLAVGGGSVIDAVKIVQLCIWADLRDDADVQHFRDAGAAVVHPANPLRMIAVPTTLSAAEFAPIAGSVNTRTGQKEPYVDPLFVPRVVVADPDALALAPRALTLATGVRTIDHCVERYCSVRAQPFSDALAVGAMQTLLADLPRVRDGDADRATYSRLQVASWMSIAAASAGVAVGASHAIGRVLGAVAGVQHGETSAILLPAVLTWNARQDTAAERQRQLVRAVGLAGDLAVALHEVIASLGMPRRLSDAGVRRDQFAKIASDALVMVRHPSVAGNARYIAHEADITEILELAW